EAKLVGLPGQAGTQLADLNARYVGGNGAKFAANLGGSGGVGIERVPMWGAARPGKQGKAFNPAQRGGPRRAGGAGAEQGGQRQAKGADGPHLQKRPARDPTW